MDKDRFCRLWRRCAVDSGGDSVDGDAVFEQLAAYYREPHRFYHTGAHIDDCLVRFDSAAAELELGPGNPDAAELAIWFHDVIYAVGAADNEQRSAEWFAEQAAGVLPTELIRRVEEYILFTTHREPPAPTNHGAQLVVDVDLSGLGMPPEDFWRDGDNIRRESESAGLVDAAEFARRQAGFLQTLLDHERIYHTDFFHDLCEAPARRNIREAIARYQSVAVDSGSD